MSQIKSKKILIIGDGLFAEIAHEYFTHDSEYEVIGFSVEEKYMKREIFLGLPVVPLEKINAHFPSNSCEVFVAITYISLNRVRTRIYNHLISIGYKCATYISSKAFVSPSAILGENCFIFEHNTIQPFVKIGDNNILWSGNHIGHHSTIGDNNFISSHVVIAGSASIKDYCFFGINSTISNTIHIASDCWIGPGVLITKNTQQGELYKVDSTPPSPVSTIRYFKLDKESST